ncbi:MAG TPA: acetoin utilization protein AcuC [Ferrovibrio sp.]|uniref:acetoin utilization protein AcuC n=1 Tax=Ferrovibrio sp. TaxID=1917215 RepID=UPI002B4ABB93|nr:acetoin utilization protein AcuC [Ferrovibrio sp.]HLT78084.1 acetoin utilization protein AcuC [Ferrovibrio sp.]
MQAPLFIGNEIYRHSTLGGKHPLSIPRVSTVMDLVAALGWLQPGQYRESRPATPEQLLRFHREDYVAAVQAAERTLAISPEDSERYNLGRGGNPVYATMFRRPATGVGGSLMAAAHLLQQGGIVYSPGGGTHHGRPAQASGFCYFNDPVLAILAMLDGGLSRVAYVDLDVHHGDGVVEAFADDPRVLVVSIHEAGRWPHSGRMEEEGAGNLFNYPVPPGMCDDEMDALIAEAVGPLVESFRPEALVMQCGADALADDPLAKQMLSNAALWRAVADLRDLAPRLLVLGGGGYNPWSVARCWTGIWAELNGLEKPDRLPPDAESLLRSLSWSRSVGRNPPEHWLTDLADAPRNGPVREEVRALLRRTRERMG